MENQNEFEGVPMDVIEALAEVRENGHYNMFDRTNVTREAMEIDPDAGMWLYDNKDRYMDALNAMGKWISS